jgi:hypothetical protein
MRLGLFQRCTGAQTPNYSDVQESVPVKLAVTINKESGEKGQNKGFFSLSLSSPLSLFILEFLAYSRRMRFWKDVG